MLNLVFRDVEIHGLYQQLLEPRTERLPLRVYVSIQGISDSRLGTYGHVSVVSGLRCW